VTTRASAAVVWDPRFLHYDFGSDHPFSERSRGLAVDLLERELTRSQVAVHWTRHVAPAPRAVIERFHEGAYVDLVERAGSLEHALSLDAGDTPSFPGCFEEAARMVAGARVALEWTIEHGRPAFHPAGGLHHAQPDRASGFCIFNDVALAVAAAIDGGRRVAYIDIDAHHGDGVMYGFYDSGRLLDIDFHQDGRTLFPGTGFPTEAGRGDGAGLKANLPLPPHAGDEALLPLFYRIVPALLRSFRPEVMVVQHGVDGHIGDRLAQLQYSSEAYAAIDVQLLALAREVCGGRILMTGGGGYRPDAVARVLARTGLVLAGVPLPPSAEPVPEEWRQQYRAEIGAPAPSGWVDVEEPVKSPWSAERTARLVGELETALGVRFPETD
jgi:acetoin utilization protein AcuC